MNMNTKGFIEQKDWIQRTITICSILNLYRNSKVETSSLMQLPWKLLHLHHLIATETNMLNEEQNSSF